MAIRNLVAILKPTEKVNPKIYLFVKKTEGRPRKAHLEGFSVQLVVHSLKTTGLEGNCWRIKLSSGRATRVAHYLAITRQPIELGSCSNHVRIKQSSGSS